MPNLNWIQLYNVQQNNLQGFDLKLPLGSLIVITGPSGSGKSSLAFDTIYAEGQRRYIETFSPYTRQFLERMNKPQVDAIEGIPPAIAIEQVNNIKTSRSTVGTITEINDYLKLFMSHLAQAECPKCHHFIHPESAPSILKKIIEKYDQSNLLIAFPVATGNFSKKNKELPSQSFFDFLQQQGYLRIWWNQQLYTTEEPPQLGKLPASILVIQDRMLIDKKKKSRLNEALETALRLGKGEVTIIDPKTGVQEQFSSRWQCTTCGIEIPPPSPGLFSFNHPLGACPECRGFGRVIDIDYQKIVPDPSLSLAEGAIKAFQTAHGSYAQKDLLQACYRKEIDPHLPFEKLLPNEKEFVLQGEKDSEELLDELEDSEHWYGVSGFFKWLERKAYKMHIRVLLSRYRSYQLCPKCHGGRYQPATLYYKLTTEGKKYTLPDLNGLPVKKLLPLLQKVTLTSQKENVAILKNQLVTRLGYLERVGLGYLTLDRPTKTLSGGEVERVSLTSCLGTSLVNTLFVMDEPTVGLHPRDVTKLLEVMQSLRNQGNTLLVVEHEEAVIRAADHLVDIGPGRGIHGGQLVYNGPPKQLLENNTSLTAAYLRGTKTISTPKKRRLPQEWIQLLGVRHHNLQNVDVTIPLGVFCCITGVSGSGKSSLITEVLYRNLISTSSSEDEAAGFCRSIQGGEELSDIVMVDQSPLSRTPRSTPALYLGFFDTIRELFGMTSEAIEANLTPSDFSFNSGKGRCGRCAGLGVEKIEMQFLSDLYLRCPECDGKRYQKHILNIYYQQKNIYDVLEMTAEEAISFFQKSLKSTSMIKALKLLQEVGLGYLKLGQPINTLSGGESQRLKLAARLQNQEESRALLIFDEPTRGLHTDDVATLLKVFHRLVEAGNSLLVVEHHLDVIKSADWIVDIGPEAGDEGGKVVATGTPEAVAQIFSSHTGRYLSYTLDHPEGAPKEFVNLGSPPTQNQEKSIIIRGAQEHNLKNLSLKIPRDHFVVITGLSGSGKSTLAFDLLFAEGQRRFLDSMSPYARQFVQQMEKPAVDEVSGLPPTVAIEQRITQGGGKSTVATVTEIHQFLRLLYAKIGTQYCPECNVPVQKSSVTEITAKLEKMLAKGDLQLYAPLVRGRKGHHRDVARWALNHDFSYLLIDGVLTHLDDFQPLERFKAHDIDVLITSFTKGKKGNLFEKVKEALDIGKGTAKAGIVSPSLKKEKKKRKAHPLPTPSSLEVLSNAMNCPSCGKAFEELEPRLFSFNSPHGWCSSCHGFGEIGPKKKARKSGREQESELQKELQEENYFEQQESEEAITCMLCKGKRLNEVAHAVKIQDLSIVDLTDLSSKDLLALLKKWKFSGREKVIACDILKEVKQRLTFLSKVGLDYLQLDRSVRTLSGGESQRIRLAAQLGSNLKGVLYILDEPTIGLHPRDNKQLLESLEQLRSQGNSVIVVEHDDETIRHADTVIDMGPGAGKHGGEIIAQGDFQSILNHPKSQTGKYLRSPLQHPIRQKRRSLKDTPGWITLRGAHRHNIQQLDVRFPLERLTVISGVSGSGKSTLLRGILLPSLTTLFNTPNAHEKPPFLPHCDSIEGWENLSKVIEVDQSPIGKTSRSTPATYLKVFNTIRELYATTQLARLRGYTASRFSFNNAAGRCPSCEGQGVIKFEMNFLPTSYAICEECQGKRFNHATLEVLYDGKSIADVLEMSFEEAATFFKAHSKIAKPLQLLVDTGLGYLQLGQPSPTLSGGEAQRLKLVTQLSKGLTSIMRLGTAKKVLYILEEPTVGLHTADVARLLEVLHRLVDEGHTVIVVEHHLDLLAEADYLIDIGPDAAHEGGKIVSEGTPEKVAKSKKSRTAPFLKEKI